MSIRLPLKITPSRMMSGMLPPEIDFWPRTCMLGSEPATPDWEICTPVVMPRSRSIGFVLGAFEIGESPTLTVATDPVKFSRLTVP